MQVSISKAIGNDAETFVFRSQIWETNCESAKQFAVSEDAVFELDLSKAETPDIIAFKVITLESLLSLLLPDKETAQLIRNSYDPDKTNEAVEISISYLSISCSGRVKLTIPSPEIDSGLKLAPNSADLKIGLQFSFQSGLTFSQADMECQT